VRRGRAELELGVSETGFMVYLCVSRCPKLCGKSNRFGALIDSFFL
jgi:hypothetical protein